MDRACPHFFKVFFPSLYAHHLKIPPAFEKRMVGDASTVFSLEGPGGNTWTVELVRDSAGMRFVCGWNDFVVDNSLSAGDFLVFKYEGRSRFKVLVFDESSCLKGTALPAIPSRPADTADGEETGVAHTEAAPKKKRGRPPKQKDSSLEQRCLMKKEADVPEITESCKICVLRIGSLSSKRRPVTEAELNRTLKNARSFKSKRPFVAIIMEDSYVYNRLFLNIPWAFASKNLLTNGKINLRDSKGKTWPASYIHDKKHCGLGAGWGEFSYAHNLEKDDVCIFELIAKHDMHVHIYRVVEELTPLTKVFEHGA